MNIFYKAKMMHCESDPFPMSDFKNSGNIDIVFEIIMEIVNLCI